MKFEVVFTLSNLCTLLLALNGPKRACNPTKACLERHTAHLPATTNDNIERTETVIALNAMNRV